MAKKYRMTTKIIKSKHFQDGYKKEGDIGPSINKSDVDACFRLNENFSDARWNLERRDEVSKGREPSSSEKAMYALTQLYSKMMELYKNGRRNAPEDFFMKAEYVFLDCNGFQE